MTKSSRWLAALALGAAVAVPAAAHAQGTAGVSSKKNAISINPLGLLWGVFSGEYEHAMAKDKAFALSGSLYAPSGFTYTSAEAKFRYYPSALNLRGFSFGTALGYTAVSADSSGTCTADCSQGAVTFGLELGYNWFLGQDQSFAVGTGIGAKRLFFTGEQLQGVSTALPTLRLSIGYSY